MNLKLTPAALDDLRSIRVYTLERWGPAQEAADLDRVWNKFEELMANPQRFRFRPDLFPGCQVAVEGKHVILFCVRGATLHVVRVLHGAMDLKRHVPPPAL